jgi:hypothetical protein
MQDQSLWRDSERASLAERHEQLRRTSQAMWLLLKSRLDISDNELRRALTAVTHDTIASSQLLDCSVCRHPVQSNAKCCLYCGTAPLQRLHTSALLRVRHIQQ